MSSEWDIELAYVSLPLRRAVSSLFAQSRGTTKTRRFLRLVLEALSHATPADRFCFRLTAPGVDLLYQALHVSFGLGNDP